MKRSYPVAEVGWVAAPGGGAVMRDSVLMVLCPELCRVTFWRDEARSGWEVWHGGRGEGYRFFPDVATAALMSLCAEVSAWYASIHEYEASLASPFQVESITVK